MIRDAVILAAGKGTRLRTSDDDLPKPLHRVGGVPLIKRTILSLAEGGVTRVVVVTGFMANLVREIGGDKDFEAANVRVEFAHNEEFEKSNGISVIVGGRRCEGAFLLSMADHIYTSAIVRLLASQDLANADLYLATDTRVGEQLDIDDATKVKTDGGRIVEIGKTIPVYDRIDCGVFCVTQKLVDALEVVRKERGDCSLSNGVQRLAEQGRARVADIGDAWWQDVDTPADRAHAEAALGEARVSHVVLLGAGLGARLRPLTDDRPKCVIEIDGEPLARRMLRQFADRGIRAATVVVGHFADRARELIGSSVRGMKINFVENVDYATTNTMYSTLLAIGALIDGGFLVEGDIIAADAVIDRLVGADPTRSHWAVDAWTPAHSGSRLWTAGTRRIVKQEIHRSLTETAIPNAWKSSGMLRLTGETAQQLEQLLSLESNRNIYYDDVIGKHLDALAIDVLDLEGAPWFEIDDLNDMAQARSMFE